MFSHSVVTVAIVLWCCGPYWARVPHSKRVRCWFSELKNKWKTQGGENWSSNNMRRSDAHILQIGIFVHDARPQIFFTTSTERNRNLQTKNCKSKKKVRIT